MFKRRNQKNETIEEVVRRRLGIVEPVQVKATVKEAQRIIKAGQNTKAGHKPKPSQEPKAGHEPRPA